METQCSVAPLSLFFVIAGSSVVMLGEGDRKDDMLKCPVRTGNSGRSVFARALVP